MVDSVRIFQSRFYAGIDSTIQKWNNYLAAIYDECVFSD